MANAVGSFMALVPEKRGNAFLPLVLDSDSNDSLRDSITRLVGSYQQKNEDDEALNKSMQLMSDVWQAQDEDEELNSQGEKQSSFLTRSLRFIGETIVTRAIFPLLRFMATAITRVAGFVLRATFQLLIRPILIAAAGFIAANPLLVALLAGAGLGYFLYKKFVDNSNAPLIANPAADKQYDYSVDRTTEATDVVESEVPASPKPVEEAPEIKKTWIDTANEKLGFISKQEESGKGNVGTVSTGKGDHGGVSYGKHQLASQNGSMTKFLKSPEGQPFAGYFAGLHPGSKAFNERYKEIASRYAQEFDDAQYKYLVRTHYDAQVNKLKRDLGLDVTKRSKAIQEAVFSAAIQYGPGTSVIVKAWKGLDFANMTDAELIVILYDYKAATVDTYFKSSDAKNRASIKRRAQREKTTVLAYEKKVQSTSLAKATPTTETTPTVIPTNQSSGAQSSTPKNKNVVKLPSGVLASVNS